MDGVPWQNDLEECAVHDGKDRFRRAIVYRERGDLLRRDTEGYERFWTHVRVSDPSQVHCCVCGDEVEYGYVTLEAATYEGPLPILHVNNYCVVFLVDGPVVRKVTRKARKAVKGVH